MIQYKRLVLVILICISVIFSGCKQIVKDEDIPENYTIYASFYPVYALASLIINEDIPGISLMQLIQPQDGCLRSYTLSDWDAYLLSGADAVILCGNGLESFAGAYTVYEGEGPAQINVTSALALEVTEDEGVSEESHLYGANPWLFMSATGALSMTESICANMIALDPKYESAYLLNLEKATERLNKLYDDIIRLMENADRNTPVALMHEGLIYTAKELGLNVCARIDHESGVTEEEERIIEILSELKESKAEVVLIEKKAPDSLTNRLTENGYRVVLIDTLSTGNQTFGADGYFEAIYDNAAKIANALR
ncbi:MAG: zinc ABC transporter substrate-binding protein [Clostridia bacterium]|nr:zinc ABC transporter substrate-binding protein [Clostridia bacterium]MBQ4157543.1 zinc ABC transporter substrate-binding protein [Clostridia bacterium]